MPKVEGTKYSFWKKLITFLQGLACTSCWTGVECVWWKRNVITWVSRRADTHDAQLSGLGVDRKFTLTAQPRSPTSTSTNESTRQSKEGRNRHSVRINLALYNKYLYEKKKVSVLSSLEVTMCTRLQIPCSGNVHVWIHSYIIIINLLWQYTRTRMSRYLTHLRWSHSQKANHKPAYQVICHAVPWHAKNSMLYYIELFESLYHVENQCAV